MLRDTGLPMLKAKGTPLARGINAAAPKTPLGFISARSVGDTRDNDQIKLSTN